MKPFDRLIALLTNPWFAASYLGLVVISFLYFDQPVAYYFHDLSLETNFPWLVWVTNIGLGVVYLVSLFALALFFRYVYKNKLWELRFWFLWLCVAIPAAITLILKIFLGRARPRLLFSDDLYGFFGFSMNTDAGYWSFPSGHTTTMMGLAFGLCIVFPRYAYAFITGGLVVSLSRVILTNHFLSDVMMTTYLVFFEIAMLYVWLKRNYCVDKLTACSPNA